MINEYKAVKIPKESYDKLNEIRNKELKYYEKKDIKKFDMLSNMGAGAFIGDLIYQIAIDKVKKVQK